MLYVRIAHFLLSLTIILVIGFLIAANKNFIERFRLGNREIKKSFYTLFICLTIWFLILFIISRTIKALPLSVFFSTLFITLILVLSPLARPFLRVTPPTWAYHIQVHRLFLEACLLLYFLGEIVPFQFTSLGFNYDFVVGVSALVAGTLFFGKLGVLRMQALVWNVFGIILILYFYFLVFLSSPGDLRVFSNRGNSTSFEHFPLILITGFLHPMAIGCHVFALKQLWLMRKKPKRINLERRS